MLDSARSLLPDAATGHRPRISLLLAALAALFALVLLGGCTGTRGGPIPYDVKGFGQPDSPVITVESADYRIAPMDTLKINVFQVPELSGDFEVDLLGNISLPLVGEVKAADLTMTQLDRTLSSKLGEKYLQNPDVTVGLKHSTRRNVTVEGAVNNPGMFAINGPTTLLQAIAIAKGVSQDSNPHRVAIFRTIDGKRMAAAFDLYSVRRGKMEDPPVYAGDIIVVDGSRIRQIQNQILMTLPIIGMFNPIIY